LPRLDQSRRIRLVDLILTLLDGKGCSSPQKRITDPQAVEIVWRNSQCVLNQTGRCPLLIFGKQLADELNEFFAEGERSGNDF
jgi:hypothetical protein